MVVTQRSHRTRPAAPVAKAGPACGTNGQATATFPRTRARTGRDGPYPTALAPAHAPHPPPRTTATPATPPRHPERRAHPRTSPAPHTAQANPRTPASPARLATPSSPRARKLARSGHISAGQGRARDRRAPRVALVAAAALVALIPVAPTATDDPTATPPDHPPAPAEWDSTASDQAHARSHESGTDHSLTGRRDERPTDRDWGRGRRDDPDRARRRRHAARGTSAPTTGTTPKRTSPAPAPQTSPAPCRHMATPTCPKAYRPRTATCAARARCTHSPS